jgi:signal transduction histidine kinase
MRNSEARAGARGRDEGPFFGTPAKTVAFLGAFLVSLVVQISVVFTMYWTSRNAVTRVLGNELTAIADSAASSITTSMEQNGNVSEIASMLWRTRQSGRLEYAVVIDDRGRVLADSWNGATGSVANSLSATPALVRRVLGTAAPSNEQIMLLGEPYLRTYWPLRWGGEVKGILCMDTHDRLPEGLTALELPLSVGVAVSFVSAFALGAAVLAVMRFFDRSKQEMVRVDRLATAGTLAASLAHEIRNPMGVVLSATELLAEADNITPTQREMLDDVREEVVRIDGHLDSFLDITRDMPMKMRDEDLREIVSKAVAILRTKARHAGVLVESCIGDTPLVVSADKRKLHQAFVNLILNAMEACGQGGGTVFVAVNEGTRTEGCTAVVTIRDDGPGMEPAVLKRVWDPFFTTKATGTGLGLSGALQTIERHGGSLSLASTPGAGTVATAVLPLAEHGEQP